MLEQFIQPDQSSPITVGALTYRHGSILTRLGAGIAYQYLITWHEYWRNSLMFLDDYFKSAYYGWYENEFTS